MREENEFQSREQGFDRETFESENPYFRSHVHDDDEWMGTQSKTYGFEEEPTHFFTVRKLLCISFFLIAVFSVIAAFVFTRQAQKNWRTKVYELQYTEEEVSDQLSIYENNTIFLPNAAYTMITRENFPSFPKGMKLIMIPFQVKSEHYQSDAYPLRNIFIGYSSEKGKEEDLFKEPTRGEQAEIYLAGYPFKNNYRYAGNGQDEYAFAFLFVPDDLDSFTLYIDKKTTTSPIEKLEARYYKEMQILPYDEALISKLDQMVREEGWK